MFAPGALRIAAHSLEVGDAAGQGAAPLTTSGTERDVTVSLAVADASIVNTGDRVDVTLPSGDSVRGRVTDVGTVATAATSSTTADRRRWRRRLQRHRRHRPSTSPSASPTRRRSATSPPLPSPWRSPASGPPTCCRCRRRRCSASPTAGTPSRCPTAAPRRTWCASRRACSPPAATSRSKGDVTEARAGRGAVMTVPVELRGVGKRYPGGSIRCCAASTSHRATASWCDRRPVRLRQVDAAAHHRHARPAQRRAIVHSPATTSRGLSDRSSSALRARQIGFVFQQFFLLDGLTALDNVADGLLYAGVPPRERRRARARPRSSGSGSATGSTHRPRSCRAASGSAWRSPARSSARPAIVLADEPTGNLDTRAGAGILDAAARAARRGHDDRRHHPRPRASRRRCRGGSRCATARSSRRRAIAR